MIQLSSSVFFILKSAVQTPSQFSPPGISTLVGGYRAHVRDGKTEARSDGAQQQTSEPGNLTKHSCGNSLLAAEVAQGTIPPVPPQCHAPFCTCLETLTHDPRVLRVRGEFSRLLQVTMGLEPWGRRQQAGPPCYPPGVQAHVHTHTPTPVTQNE